MYLCRHRIVKTKNTTTRNLQKYTLIQTLMNCLLSALAHVLILSTCCHCCWCCRVRKEAVGACVWRRNLTDDDVCKQTRDSHQETINFLLFFPRGHVKHHYSRSYPVSCLFYFDSGRVGLLRVASGHFVLFRQTLAALFQTWRLPWVRTFQSNFNFLNLKLIL